MLRLQPLQQRPTLRLLTKFVFALPVFFTNAGSPVLWRPFVGDFNGFLRANDFTMRIADLTSYRCLIAINHLSDILENLEITFGDISISVLIQVEKSARDGDAGRGNPPIS